MSEDPEMYRNEWGSRKMIISAMLAQTIGSLTITKLPQQALKNGAAGYMLMYSITYILIGIPLLFMEFVVSQFTSRDCIDVWKARPLLSHIGYIQILWQLNNVIFTHTFGSFVLHYFLISFEDPIPFFHCGVWSNKDCNILSTNYTIHEDCCNRRKERPLYCASICNTFPEYQYWRFYILGLNKNTFHMAWRVTLASGLLCITLFLSTFRRIRSLKCVLLTIPVFLVTARFLFMFGSMVQKGIVVEFGDALDVDFSTFANKFQLSATMVDVMLSLNLGSGISFNLASRDSFRSPCYSNTVIVVVISNAITVIGILSYVLMICPYAFKYNVYAYHIASYPIFMSLEMTPRLLYVYESRSFWLKLCLCVSSVSYMCVNIITISSLLEVMGKRYPKVTKYPALVTAAAAVLLFVVTIPLLGSPSLLFLRDMQGGFNFILVFIILLETIVFLLCYGLHKFSEDVHFMLGVQPNSFMKTSWIISVIAIIYTFCAELCTIYLRRKETTGYEAGCWLSTTIVLVTLLITIVKLVKAFYAKNLNEAIDLDHSWGPKSELLQRSRAMFTTHAMTKEYIYRQYHLQAGILKRQKACNRRR